jgi:hypothetical protein
MKPGIFKPNAKTRDRIARWISFLALVALLAMATLPITSGQPDVAANHATHGSKTWHG